MDEDYWYRRVWKILDAAGDAGFLLEADNEFWLEPQHVSGTDKPRFYEVKFEPKKMNPQWTGTVLFPLGVRNPELKVAGPNPPDKLPPFDAISKAQYMETADQSTYGADSRTIRLEGTVGTTEDVACFYVFPSATTAGRDWIVVNVMDGSKVKQDGTAHGDPK